jgi:hypothetical protein
MEFDDECVRVSFTSTSAAIVVFLALVGLLGVYEIGRDRGRDAGYRSGFQAGRASFEADAASDIDAARRQPASPHLVEDLRAAADTATERSADNDDGADVHWVKGLTYIVAQEFAPGAEADAREAQTYLRSRGIDAAVIPQDNDWFQLVTTQGYDRSDPVQRDLSDKLLARAHAAGAEYYADGGGYKLEGYFKTLRNDRW